VAFILEMAGQGRAHLTPAKILVGIEFAGAYGFTLAHFLHGHGFQIVNVLPSDTKRWKEVMHHQALKTDAKDALGITDLTATGHFVSFAFLEPTYAELRYLVSTRERFAMLHRAGVTRLKSTLELVFPEFETHFASLQSRTALAVLEAYPSPQALRAAPCRRLLELLRTVSLNHLGKDTADALRRSAKSTLGLPLAQGALAHELPLIIAQIRMLEQHLAVLEAEMQRLLETLPEGPYLLTIPWVSVVTAATFVGSVGDVRAYDSSRQIIRLAGMSLVEKSSGTHQGQQRLSKRGRPTLRRHAFILALRWIRKDGPFRAAFEAMTARNGEIKMKAVVAIARRALKILYTVARERRPFVPVHVPPGVAPRTPRTGTPRKKR
jgi:transposase